MRLGHSARGWTDNELGVEWIKHFDKQTATQSKGRTRLLLVDGHASHCTLDFLEYAKSHCIEVLCYPAHATHIYQRLDVGVFGVLKTVFNQLRDEWEAKTRKRAGKENFLALFGEA